MDFVRAAQEMVSGLLRLRPEWATGLGEHAHDDRLNDLSEDGDRELRVFARRSRDALAAVDAAALSTSDAVDLEIAAVGLERILFDLDLHEKAWNPLAWLPGDALYPLLMRETTPVGHRLRALAGRLAEVPDRLALARATLTDLPLVHVETALTQTSGTLLLVRDEVSRLLTRQARIAQPRRAGAGGGRPGPGRLPYFPC
jgi:hypothetical protein